MKKAFSLSLILLFLIIPLFICAVGQQEKGPVKLTFIGRDAVYGDAIDIAISEYVKLNPQVSIENLELPYASQYEKVVIDMKGAVGTYDLILIDDPAATQFQRAGWLANLDELLKKRGEKLDPDLISTAVKLGRYPYADDGTLYGLPHIGNVELFVYRKDLFQKYGLSKPEKWDDVLAAAKKIQAGEKDVYGVVFRGVKGNPITSTSLPLFWAFGANVLDSKGRPALDTPEARNAWEFFLKLKDYAPEGVAAYNSAQVKDALYSGRAAMAIEVWPGWVPGLNDPSKSAVVGKAEVTTHPGQVKKSSPMLGIWLIGIPEASKNHEEALDFLLFLTGKETQIKIAEIGLPPTRESVFMEPGLIKKFPWYPVQVAAMKNGVGRPRTTQWKELEDIYGAYLQLVLIGKMTPADALKEANSKMKEVLE